MPDSTVSVVGNMTREADLRYTSGGRAVASFGVAVNRRYQSNNEWVEEVSFFDIVCWANLAENVCASLNKGDRVVVTGRISQRSWEADDGTKRSKIEITADEVGASLRFANVKVEKLARERPTAGAQQEEQESF